MTMLSLTTTAVAMKYRFVLAVRRNAEERCLDFMVSTKIYRLIYRPPCEYNYSANNFLPNSFLFDSHVHSGKG